MNNLELTKEEATFLTQVLDTYVKTHGISVAESSLYMANKIKTSQEPKPEVVEEPPTKD